MAHSAASRSGFAAAAALARACLSVADGGDLPAAVGHGVLLVHDRPAGGWPRMGFHSGELHGVLLAEPVRDAALGVAAAWAGSDALVHRHRLSRGIRARQGAEGPQPRGDLPAGDPAVLVERAGAHLLVGDGAARGRNTGHQCSMRYCRSAISIDLMYSYPAVVIGLVHSYVPYMVLTCYLTLQAIDDSLIEAARSLGASRLTTLAPPDHPAVAAGLGRRRGIDLHSGGRLFHGTAYPRRPHRHFLRDRDRGPVRCRLQLAIARRLRSRCTEPHTVLLYWIQYSCLVRRGADAIH